MTQRLIGDHLVSGRMEPGEEIALRVDQTLTQDATGTLVMQELEALALERVRTEVSVQYVDHNILQADERNAEDHLFLRSAARRFGLWFSKPGNGVSHPTHMQHFGIPGKTLAGSDSHTCAGGSLGMLAIGTGGLEVALAMAGRPLHLTMPEIWGIRLTGELPPWVSAKDVILEMLRRHGVQGGVRPPGNVVGVREVAGEPVGQVVIGSSANPGLRDFAVPAAMVKGRQTAPGVSFDINPTSREILQDLTRCGATFELIAAGARIHQSGALGCIGMGQAPAAGRNSLRTFPRNFPGRSGTDDDAVWLCSPETATASALTGTLTDPRDWAARCAMPCPAPAAPDPVSVNHAMLEPPLPPDEALRVELERGPNISALPELDPLPDEMELPVLLKAGDDVSTDEISPAGAKALPYRSNIPKLAEFTLTRLDPDYPRRAKEVREGGGHVIVAGENYGQGSSREHAALTPRHLGLRAVLAKSYARIHWQNLANFGVLALEFDDPDAYGRIGPGDRLRLTGLHEALAEHGPPALRVRNTTRDEEYPVHHRLSPGRRRAVLAGGIIPALAR
ncbi:hypothetical protein JCM4914_63830 [Streptomyces platensis subsp. malvinus]